MFCSVSSSCHLSAKNCSRKCAIHCSWSSHVQGQSCTPIAAVFQKWRMVKKRVPSIVAGCVTRAMFQAR
eukprot:6020677-Amphidinium_carterae.1